LSISLNPLFTGRQKHLDKIRQSFETKENIALTVAITGMGGIGKTQLALRYASEYENDYDNISVVIAETENTCISSFQAFLRKINHPETEAKEADAIIQAVHQWMHDNDNWLFIFDHVEDESSVKKYIPASRSGRRHILITSRNTQCIDAATINLNVLSKRDACIMLVKYTRNSSDEFCEKLAEELGYLPLALDHAGAYMNISKDSFKDYLELFFKKKEELFSEDRKLFFDETIAATLNITLEKIGENTAARQLLYICAFFAAENIHKEFLKTASQVLPDELREATADDVEFNKAIDELVKYSFIFQDDEGVISIHRLMREVIRESPENEQSLWRSRCILILNELIFFDFSNRELRERFRILAAHITAVTNDNIIEETEELANLFYFLGWGYDDLADYELALEYYGKALSIKKKVLGEEHPNTATTYNNIAVVYKNRCNYELALEYYGKALSINEKVLGAEHPDTATTCNNMAVAYHKTGDYELASEYFSKALTIREKVLGKDHPATAATYNNLATVYEAQGKTVLALEYYSKASAIEDKVSGLEHHSSASKYNDLAAVYFAQGDYDLALENYKKALAVVEKVLGKEHPITVATYNNIANVYDNMGKYERALEYFSKALAVVEKVSGTEHPDTATTYNNMALVYDNRGRYKPALEYYGKALSIYEKVLGTEHPDTATIYNNMANVYDAQGKYKLALEYYRKALAIYGNVLGEEHPYYKGTNEAMKNTAQRRG